MNKSEAKNILIQHLEGYRSRSYEELLDLLDEPERADALGPTGVRYQLEVEAVWDDQPHGNLRVLGSIDDGGWRSMFPLSEDFILSPSGEFVDE